MTAIIDEKTEACLKSKSEEIGFDRYGIDHESISNDQQSEYDCARIGTIRIEGGKETIVYELRPDNEADESSSRYAVEWPVRGQSTREFQIQTFLFSSFPTPDDIETARVIRDLYIRFQEGDLAQYFRCEYCGVETHWTEISIPDGDDPIERYVEFAASHSCGCRRIREETNN